MPVGEDVWIPSACSMCYSFCAIKVHRVDGRVVKIEGNPDSATGQGRLCPRGVSGMMLLYDPSRINAPLKRTNPEKGLDTDPGWQEISWEEALDTVSERLKQLRAEDPRKLLAVSSVSFRNDTIFPRLFANVFGSPNSWNSGAGNHCGNAEHLFGALLHSAWCKQPDTDYCNYLLNFGVPCGFGAYYTVPGMAQRMADARERGMKHVVIDPLLSPTAEKADEWVPIRPGTDGALALAMLNLLLNELKVYDASYLKRYTNGPYLIGDDGYYLRDEETGKPLVWDAGDHKAKPYDAPDSEEFVLEGEFSVYGYRGRTAFSLLKDGVKKYPPELVSQITTVPAATIYRLTQEFADAARIGSTITIQGHELPYRPVAVLYFKGAQGHKNALLNAMALELLTEMVGASNVPGGLLGQNSRCLGHPEMGKPSWSPKEGPDGLLVAAGGWPRMANVYPPRSVTPSDSMDLKGMIPTASGSSASTPLVMKEPKRFHMPYSIEFVLHMGANFPMTFGDPLKVADAFQGAFQVSSSLFLDEATYLADIVLPDTCYLERLSLDADWVASNAPGGEWCFHLRQPVVAPGGGRRSISEVILEIARRTGMEDEFYSLLNAYLDLEKPYALEAGQHYTWEEIVDRHYRAMFGDERGIAWFKKHGVLKWPKKVEEVYWKPFIKARVPIYFEWFKRAGEQVANLAQELGIADVIDTASFQPLPHWRPCPSYEESRPEYDLFAFYYRVPIQTFSGTYNNPWLDEASQIDPFTYHISINTQTARQKGIKDGDWVQVISAATGHSIRARARLTEGIHPEAMAMANCGGHWSRYLPLASQPEKGACFEWLVPLDWKHVDIPTLTQDLCVKVKVSRVEGP
ncbi:MAG: molybdopterin-dependent oxidoreductase [Chloroflexi bacterium]|nr:molybdopterin-dependent oxidoreductase [Chloroflexota bacterium]